MDGTVTQFPFEIRDLDPELEKKREPYFIGEKLVRVGPKNYLVYGGYANIADDIYNIVPKPDDVYLIGYPRSGTTLMTEMLWLITHDLHFDAANTLSYFERCPYLEGSMLFMEASVKEWFTKLNKMDKEKLSCYIKPPNKMLDEVPSPRIVKSHLPLSLLPPKLLDMTKVLYIARDPRDVSVSRYLLLRNSVMVQYKCDFNTYWRFFIKDAISYTPFLEHMKEAWEKRCHPNMLFLFYEDIIMDLPSTVRKVLEFLGKHYSDDQLAHLCDHLSFSRMKNNKNINGALMNHIFGLNPDGNQTFIRKGVAGGWREYFDEQTARESSEFFQQPVYLYQYVLEMDGTVTQFPFEIRDLDPELEKKREPYFIGEKLVRVGPKNYLVYGGYANIADDIYNIVPKPDDVYLIGYPRSGTTLMTEMLWLITHDLDFDAANTLSYFERCPYLESSMVLMEASVKEWFTKLNKMDKEELSCYIKPPNKILDEVPSPRIVKSHLPLSLLPPQLLDMTKVLYVARDPRDVAVSNYLTLRNSVMVQYKCDFNTYWRFFMKDAISYTPFLEHMKEAWEKRCHSNMLFLFYEDIIKDLPSTVRKVSDFLGKHYSDDQLAHLCDHLSFSRMKNNKNINGALMNHFFGLNPDGNQTFIRKGVAGGWREYFDEQTAREAEEWLTNGLRGTGLTFERSQ